MPTVTLAINKPIEGQNLTSDVLPDEMKNVGITEHLGEKIDLGLKFRNEEGKGVTLQNYFDGKRPVLLSLVYYNCPNLCNEHLNGVTRMLKDFEWTLGQEFDMIIVTIDPNENPLHAAQKKLSYLKEYGRDGATKGWHFLTGTEENIQKLAKQIGFGYKWDKKTEQWVHTAAAYVISPQGMISRYLYGIEFKPKLVRLSLVEASEGKVGTLMDRVVLFCLQYDPKAGTYTFYAYNLMRAAGALTVLILAFVLISFWLKQRRRSASSS